MCESVKKSHFDQIQTISALTFGSVMLILGLIIPLFVPANQQNEVLIMTFFFTLTGMLLLHSARSHKNAAGLRRGLSLFGGGLACVGLAIPLMRVQISPDERFFWMIAYMPVLIGGLFFTELAVSQPKKSQPPQSAPTAIRRNPVQRVPQDTRYQRILPIALITIFVFILIVVALVLIPALGVFLR